MLKSFPHTKEKESIIYDNMEITPRILQSSLYYHKALKMHDG